jgi:hypothetical protein
MDFRVASKVFWSAAFAIQRGIPNKDVKETVWGQIWGLKLSRTYKAAVAEDSAKTAWEFEATYLLSEF